MPTMIRPIRISLHRVSAITLSVAALAVVPSLAAAATGPDPRPPTSVPARTAVAGPVDTEAFLRRVAKPARRSHQRHQVPASVTIAQAILESGWGRSRLASVDRNYFGIKCSAGQPGPIASGCRSYETSEHDGKGYHRVIAKFRVYRTVGGSFRDHGAFLKNNTRYRAAFRYSRAPERFARAIAAAGYATSPTYADSLIGLMRRYDLYRFDPPPSPRRS